MTASCYQPLDEALEAIAGYGITLNNGNSNHAPMVAEALCALGRPEAVMPWIAAYRQRLLPRSPPAEPIGAETWCRALGCRDRFADWAEFFAEELGQWSWREVLDRWMGRLAPGFCAAATHGVIRVGHAVRGLADAENPWRRGELGDALASWAATYRELPCSDLTAIRPMPPREAIAKIPIMPPQRRNSGNITASLAMLDDFPELAPVVGLLEISGDLDALLAELTDVFARIYLTNVHDARTSIVFVHGVTSVTALGGIIPYISKATAIAALRYGWQAACALYACFGTNPLAEHIEQSTEDTAALVDRAVANGDEHIIKFTEACLRRNTLAPSPAYCAAVDHALAVMRR